MDLLGGQFIAIVEENGLAWNVAGHIECENEIMPRQQFMKQSKWRKRGKKYNSLAICPANH